MVIKNLIPSSLNISYLFYIFGSHPVRNRIGLIFVNAQHRKTNRYMILKVLSIATISVFLLFSQKSFSQSGNAPKETMLVNESVMVTVDLDLGQPVPTVEQALKLIERKYAPKDGKDRTFAILDAVAETSPFGKMHLSMHISSEKEGGAMLILKSTGKVLWDCQVVPNPNKPYTGEPKKLTIYIDYDGKKSFTVDASSNPPTIFDAKLLENKVSVIDFWSIGQEKELVFVYSACGCPVHIKAKRTAFKKSERTSNSPVMFPDDPAVVTLIGRLLGW